METMKKRELYIDYIKALGICLVILLHCSFFPGDSLFVKGVYSMSVPLFFVVNGYLMLRKEHTISGLLRKNLKLLLVLVVWALITTAQTMWVRGEWNEGVGGLRMLLRNSLTISMDYCGHLWFLRSLFFLNILNPILYYFIHYNKKGIYYLLIILFLCTARFFDIIVGKFYNPLYGWDWYPVLYYVMGYALLDGHLLTERIKIWMLGLAIALLLLMQWGYNWMFLEGPLAQLNISHDWIPTDNYIWYGYWSPIIVVATGAVCALFKKINWNNSIFWEYIGRNSLPIYLMQSSVISIIAHMAWYKNLIAWCNFLCIVLPIISLLVCVALTYGLQTNKYSKYMMTI